MINHIEGRLVEKTPTYAILDVHGIGYHINISLSTYSRIPEFDQILLLTHLSVREDAHILYGFIDEEERSLFRHLISVSGVGPNTARMILSSMNPAEIKAAIISGNVPLLKRIKGIGEKSAQRIIIDLKDKIGKETSASQITFLQGGNNTTREEALSALVMLGFVRAGAEKEVDKILKNTPDVTVEQLLKQALKQL